MLMPDVRAVAQRRGDVRRVERRDRRRDLRHRLAEARAERAVVGLDLVGAELVGLGDVADLLDVELVAHDVGEPVERRALAVRGDDHRGAQRLAHLELGLRTRAQPEADRLARHAHVELERLVALTGDRKVLEVDAVLGAVEVVVDLVGDERRERCEQLGDRDQAGVERAERGRIAVPEAAARAAHVPVRELVDERGDRVAGARGVVVVEAVAHGRRRWRSAATAPSGRGRSPAPERSVTSLTFAYIT